MAHTPNRMETHWPQLMPLILQEWDRLNEADLQTVEGQFDRFVKILRERYGGRQEIIQEAAIRDRLNQMFRQISHSKE